jgi:hypothetical protein
MQPKHPDLDLVRINAEAKQFFIYVMSIPSNPDYRVQKHAISKVSLQKARN